MTEELSEDTLQAMAGLGNIYEDRMRKTMKIPDDWRYTRVGFSNQNWDIWNYVVGSDQWATVSGIDKDGTGPTLSLFISPQGALNLQADMKMFIFDE